MDCSSIHSSVHGNSPAENTGVGCYALLQGISPTQGLNPGLLHCRRILYCLSHQASPGRKMKEIKIDQKLSGNIIPDYVFLKTERVFCTLADRTDTLGRGWRFRRAEDDQRSQVHEKRRRRSPCDQSREGLRRGINCQKDEGCVLCWGRWREKGNEHWCCCLALIPGRLRWSYLIEPDLSLGISPTLCLLLVPHLFLLSHIGLSSSNSKIFLSSCDLEYLTPFFVRWKKCLLSSSPSKLEPPPLVKVQLSHCLFAS